MRQLPIIVSLKWGICAMLVVCAVFLCLTELPIIGNIAMGVCAGIATYVVLRMCPCVSLKRELEEIKQK
jgi:hypothetical protein